MMVVVAKVFGGTALYPIGYTVLGSSYIHSFTSNSNIA